MNDQQLAHLSVLTSLNDMMRGESFFISYVDAAIKTLRAMPDGRAYDILRPLHCVKWRDMPPELREAVPKLIERCINVPAHQFQLTQVSAVEQAQVQSATLRLLTR